MTWIELKKYLPIYSKQFENNLELTTKIERLEKKLDIAIKALKKIDPQNVPFKDFYHRGAILRSIARKALKDIKEV